MRKFFLNQCPSWKIWREMAEESTRKKIKWIKMKNFRIGGESRIHLFNFSKVFFCSFYFNLYKQFINFLYFFYSNISLWTLYLMSQFWKTIFLHNYPFHLIFQMYLYRGLQINLILKVFYFSDYFPQRINFVYLCFLLQLS